MGRNQGLSFRFIYKITYTTGKMSESAEQLKAPIPTGMENLDDEQHFTQA